MICSKLFIFDSYKYKNPKTIRLVNRSLAGNLRNVIHPSAHSPCALYGPDQWEKLYSH